MDLPSRTSPKESYLKDAFGSLRQFGVFILAWVCPPFGFYLINRRLDEMEDHLDEVEETIDDMIFLKMGS